MLKKESIVLARQWVTQMTFYLCRVNFAIISPLLMIFLGYSIFDIGLISTGLLVAYAVGQFVNGQLNDKYAKNLLSVGIFGSSIMTFLMAFAGDSMTMTLFWTLNGFLQSMGWNASVKIVANWFKPEARGKASGVLGTSYQIGNVFSWLLAAFAVRWGWQMGFIIPALFFAISGVHWTLKGIQAPEESLQLTIEGYNDLEDIHLGFRWTLKRALLDWKVWVGGFTLLFLNIIRYGFLTWAPLMIFQLDPDIMSATLKALIFPLAGSVGGITIGFIEKKISVIKISCVFLLILSGLMVVYSGISNAPLALITLAFIGFFTYGPHVFIVTRLPMMLATRKGSASVTGFIDAMGYVGASITTITTAVLVGIGGWNLAFIFWTIGALLSVVSLALLWNYKKTSETYY